MQRSGAGTLTTLLALAVACSSSGGGREGDVTVDVTASSVVVVAGSGDVVTLHADTNFTGTLAWTAEPLLGTIAPVSATDARYTAPSGLVTSVAPVVVTAVAGAVSDSATITVYPTVLEVTGPTTVAAGGAPVTFAVTTPIGASAVTWSVSPSSAGTIEGTGSVATFAPAAYATADVPFQVIATIGGAQGRASATLRPTPIAVTGVVADEQGRGVAGAKVIIGALSATSDALGAFTIAPVTPPYDAIVLAEGGKTISVYRGVVDAAPVLWFVRAAPGPWRSAWVGGTVTQGAELAPGTRVFCPDAFAFADETAWYSLRADWRGDAAATLPVRALQIGLDASSQPASYAFGARPVDVMDGGVVTGHDIDVAAVPYDHVTGTAAPQVEHALSSMVLQVVAHFDDGTEGTIHERQVSVLDPVAGDVDVVVPTLPGATIRLDYGADGRYGGHADASARVTPGQTGVALELPAIPAASAPAPGASGVGYETSLAWSTRNSGGMGSVYIACADGISYRIHGNTTATIPDLTAHGVSVARGTACTWTPQWVSYGIGQLVRGPAAIDALALHRSASGVAWSFTF